MNRTWAYGGLALPDGVVARACFPPSVRVPTVVSLVGGPRADGLAPYLIALATEAGVKILRSVRDETDMLLFVEEEQDKKRSQTVSGSPVPLLQYGRGPTVLLDVGRDELSEISPGQFYVYRVVLPDGGMTADGVPSALGYAAWAGQVWDLCARRCAQ